MTPVTPCDVLRVAYKQVPQRLRLATESTMSTNNKREELQVRLLALLEVVSLFLALSTLDLREACVGVRLHTDDRNVDGDVPSASLTLYPYKSSL